MSAIVVGHFSVDGQLKSDHYNFSAAHDMITVDEPSSDNHIPVSLYVDIIEKFSFAGHTVIEAIGTGESIQSQVTIILKRYTSVWVQISEGD